MPDWGVVNTEFYVQVLEGFLKRVSRMTRRFRESCSSFLLYDRAPARYAVRVNRLIPNYNQQDAEFIYLLISTDALQVSGGSAHHQEHIIVHTASGIVN